jgi:hypothetical protein
MLVELGLRCKIYKSLKSRMKTTIFNKIHMRE